jgi:hypothetical protein
VSQPPPSPRLLTRRHALAGALLLAARAALAQPTATEEQLKAAFLVRFPQHVQWPADTFKTDKDPVVIGILGKDPFGPELDAIASKLKGHARQIQPRRLRSVEDAAGCHVLYVSESETPRLPAILNALRGKPVFTVGETEDFIKLGGGLRFWRSGENVALHINNDAARAAGLAINPRLLQLSRDPATGKKD